MAALLRFAPSPTGALHLGGLRMALYNHLYAKKTGGQWILRIEDTDATRVVPGAVDGIQRALEWAGLEYDYGPGKGGPHAPYFQSERIDLYRSYSAKLLSSGHAYRCFCSMDTLTELREKFARTGSSQSYDKRCLHLTEEEVARRVRAGEKYIIRLNTSAPIVRRPTTDLVFGNLRDAHGSLGTDPILLKSDGYPTYHLANVVDDHSMGITHVLRGEEWITSLPLHLDIYFALGLEPPQFAHIPIIRNADGTKMSKRNGDVKVEDYIRRGWERSAILNWIALPGWGALHESEALPEDSATSSGPSSASDAGSPEVPSGKQEPHPKRVHVKDAPESTKVMDMDELMSEFDISVLTHRATSLEPAKLNYLNRQHLLRAASTPAGLADVTSRFQLWLDENMSRGKIRDEYTTPEYIQSVIRVMDARLINIHDLVSLAPYFFMEPDYNSEEARSMVRRASPEEINQILVAVHNTLSSTPEGTWDPEKLSKLMHSVKEEKQLPPKPFLPVVRHALTALKDGPPVAELMVVLGKSRTLARIESQMQM